MCTVQPCCHVFGQLPLGENDICSVSICCEGYITWVLWAKLRDEFVRKVSWARCSSVWVSFPKFCWARRSPFAQILEVLPRLVRLKWIVLAALSFLLSNCIHHFPLQTNNHFCHREMIIWSCSTWNYWVYIVCLHISISRKENSQCSCKYRTDCWWMWWWLKWKFAWQEQQISNWPKKCQQIHLSISLTGHPNCPKNAK